MWDAFLPTSGPKHPICCFVIVVHDNPKTVQALFPENLQEPYDPQKTTKKQNLTKNSIRNAFKKSQGGPLKLTFLGHQNAPLHI